MIEAGQKVERDAEALGLAEPRWVWRLSQATERAALGMIGVYSLLLMLLLIVLFETMARNSSVGKELGVLYNILLSGGCCLAVLGLSGFWGLAAREPGVPIVRQTVNAGTIVRVVIATGTAIVLMAAVVRIELLLLLLAPCIWVLFAAAAAMMESRLRRAGSRRASWARRLTWWFAVGPAVWVVGLILFEMMQRVSRYNNVDMVKIGVMGGLVIYGVLLGRLWLVLADARKRFAGAAQEANRRRAVTATLRTDEDGRIAMDVPCSQCGYDLRGVDPQGTCPECGAGNAVSIETHLRQASDPVWPREMAGGVTWIIMGVAAGVAISVGAALLPRGLGRAVPFQWYMWIRPAGWLAGMAVLGGVWKVTARALPGHWIETGAQRARRLARLFWILKFAVGSPPVLGPLLGSGVLWSRQHAYLSAATSGALSMAGWIALLWYLRSLAERVADSGLAERTRRVMVQVIWLQAVAIGLTVWGFFLSPVYQVQSGTVAARSPAHEVAYYAFYWGSVGVSAIFGGLVVWLAYAYRERFRGMARASEEAGEAGNG